MVNKFDIVGKKMSDSKDRDSGNNIDYSTKKYKDDK